MHFLHAISPGLRPLSLLCRMTSLPQQAALAPFLPSHKVSAPQGRGFARHQV